MAAFSGVDGNVTWASRTSLGATSQNVKSWSLDISTDELDTTDFSVSQWRTWISGLSEWSGSFEMNLDASNAITVTELYGSASTITLQHETSFTITGSALVTGVSISEPVDDIVTATCNFRGSGAPVFGAAPSPSASPSASASASPSASPSAT